MTSASSGTTDVVVVGAGFSGLYLLHRLRQMGLHARLLEKGSGVGGTWYWNRYPGARCDIESFDYCYSFSDELVREWVWSERYATQPEILRYLEHVADRFDLNRLITFDTTAEAASFDQNAGTWTVTTDTGEQITARYLVLATGNLSLTNRPDFDGLDSFTGQWFHTGTWPHEPVDFTGQSVAVIGTGSSGIQSIPKIAQQAEHLYVLQRTPNYSMPARNRAVTAEEMSSIVANFPSRRRACENSDAGTPLPPATQRAVEVTAEQRRAKYDEGWERGGISALSGAFTDMFGDEVANGYAQDYAREQIRSLVTDPQIADMLSPSHDIGTKRTCTDIDYYQTYNRDNVDLINVRANPISHITPTGIALHDGVIEVDSIVFATGFDAITGALADIDIRGRADVPLSAAWANGARAYLGLQVVGFPNMFLITGPTSPSVLSNMAISIEQHVDWVVDCLAYMRDNGHATIEPTNTAQDEWMRHVTELANATLYPRAHSWYVGTNMDGRERAFTIYIAGCGPYREECDQVVADGYRGFEFDATSTEGTSA